MAKAVKVIPAKPARMVDGLAQNAKKKACAYCRVSTDSKEQENSYESQIAYYTDYIKKRTDWAFVDIYADEGISGTSTKNRK